MNFCTLIFHASHRVTSSQNCIGLVHVVRGMHSRTLGWFQIRLAGVFTSPAHCETPLPPCCAKLSHVPVICFVYNR